MTNVMIPAKHNMSSARKRQKTSTKPAEQDASLHRRNHHACVPADSNTLLLISVNTLNAEKIAVMTKKLLLTSRMTNTWDAEQAVQH